MTTEATTTKRLETGAVRISNEERMKKETSCAISIKPFVFISNQIIMFPTLSLSTACMISVSIFNCFQ
ncbi:unnamed protein product [Brassica oleracea var. botrytis]